MSSFHRECIFLGLHVLVVSCGRLSDSQSLPRENRYLFMTKSISNVKSGRCDIKVSQWVQKRVQEYLVIYYKYTLYFVNGKSYMEEPSSSRMTPETQTFRVLLQSSLLPPGGSFVFVVPSRELWLLMVDVLWSLVYTLGDGWVVNRSFIVLRRFGLD